MKKTARIEEMSPQTFDQQGLKLSENATAVPVLPKSLIVIPQNSV